LSQIIDAFSFQNWNLNILQNPEAVHICITPNNIKNINNFIIILEVLSLQEKKDIKDDMISIYGMATKINNTEIINDVISGYLDLTTKN